MSLAFLWGGREGWGIREREVNAWPRPSGPGWDEDGSKTLPMTMAEAAKSDDDCAAGGVPHSQMVVPVLTSGCLSNWISGEGTQGRFRAYTYLNLHSDTNAEQAGCPQDPALSQWQLSIRCAAVVEQALAVDEGPWPLVVAG